MSADPPPPAGPYGGFRCATEGTVLRAERLAYAADTEHPEAYKCPVTAGTWGECGCIWCATADGVEPWWHCGHPLNPPDYHL